MHISWAIPIGIVYTEVFLNNYYIYILCYIYIMLCIYTILCIQIYIHKYIKILI